MTIRLVDLGLVSPVRSQAIYHGLAHARTAQTPDTIVLATPAEPYVCIGFHQDLEAEIDLAYCRERSLPVLRRETGGGAVYLDHDQLFVQWVMAPESLPLRIEERFRLFARPLADTYRELGLDAYFRPTNDVHVGGRKIVGTGAGHIGNAEVLVGNLIFDFDTDVMARVLKAPFAAFRHQIHKSLGEYMTSMKRELGHAPDPREVAEIYLRKCEQVLGKGLVPGELTDAEQRAVGSAEERLQSESFRCRPGGLRRDGIKIHEDVQVVERRHGKVRVAARVREGRIEDCVIEDEDTP
jgi:lipoate-protein ligase A